MFVMPLDLANRHERWNVGVGVEVKIDIIQLYLYLSKDRTLSVYLHKGSEDLFSNKDSTTNHIACNAPVSNEQIFCYERKTPHTRPLIYI